MSDAADAFEEVWEVLDQDTPERPEHWTVQDKGQADWVVRKVAKIDKELRDIGDLASQQIEAIKAWWEDEKVRLNHQRGHWELLLSRYHESVLAEDPRQKTVSLPHGRLIARKQPDNIDYDPDTLLALFAADSEYVRVKRELNRSAIKEAVLKAGEIIPGVEIVPGEVKFSVAPN